MSIDGSSNKRSGALRAEIRSVERGLAQRRGAIRDAFGKLAGNVRSQLLTPATMISAGLLGVAVHRSSHRLGDLNVLAALQPLNTWLRLLITRTPPTDA